MNPRILRCRLQSELCLTQQPGYGIATVGLIALGSITSIGCVPPQPKAPPKPNLRIDLRPVDKKTYERVLFENTGRVVLVNFWAMWDQSSMRQLAHMKALQDVYGPKGLQVVLVSLDNEAAVEKVCAVPAGDASGRINLSDFCQRGRPAKFRGL